MQAVTAAPGGTPIKESQVSLRPSTKILMGDWVWQANRSVDIPQGVWHNNQDKRRFNILYGGAHVAQTDLSSISMVVNQAMDINFAWW